VTGLEAAYTAMRLRDHVANPLQNAEGRSYGSVYIPPRDGDTSVFRDGGIVVIAWEGEHVLHLVRVDAGNVAGYQMSDIDVEAALVNLEGR